jgi:hypothetical protein
VAPPTQKVLDRGFKIYNHNKRDALKIKALRQIETNGFIIRKYIDRKYLLKDRLWKFSQIQKSMDNPMDIAALPGKSPRGSF